MSSTPINDPEKGAAAINTGSASPSQSDQHHHHLKHARERLRHFLHPSGKKIRKQNVQTTLRRRYH
jgi:hypothetical protein